MFITLYGINNIGKTTQAQRLVAKLNEHGKKAMYIKYPVYDIAPTGPFIDEILRSGNKQHINEEELQMWFTLNRFQFQSRLQEMLEQGWVIAEDYVGTGIAWGMAKGAPQEWLESINQPLLREDLAILMDGERTVSARETQHIHEENDELINRCQGIFRELGERYGWKSVLVSEDWDVTTARLWKVLESHL